jgi:hypothetical protein
MLHTYCGISQQAIKAAIRLPSGSKRMKYPRILIAHKDGARGQCELAILLPCARLSKVGFTNARSALRPGKERSRESRKDVKHSAKTIPRAQMRREVRPQRLEACEWQAPAPVAEMQKRNLSATDLFTTRSGCLATTCAVAHPAIAGDYSSRGTRLDLTRMI